MALASVFFDSVAGMMMEHAAVLTDSHVADVGVDAEQISVPGGQHEKGTNGERREERAHETAQQQAKQRLRPPGSIDGLLAVSQELFTACASSPPALRTPSGSSVGIASKLAIRAKITRAFCRGRPIYLSARPADFGATHAVRCSSWGRDSPWSLSFAAARNTLHQYVSDRTGWNGQPQHEPACCA